MTDILYITRQGEPAPAPVLFDDKGKAFCQISLACPKCGGYGELRWKSDPVCDACEGSGTSDRAEKIALYTADQVAKLDAAAQAKKARQEADRLARLEALEEDHGALLLRARAVREDSPYVARVLETIEHTASLSPAQAAALERGIAEHEAGANSEHVGEIGANFCSEVTIAKVRPFKSRFKGKKSGPMVAVTMVAGGQELVAFGAFTCKAGETFTVQAKVKEHKMFRGQRQTVLERAKLSQVA